MTAFSVLFLLLITANGCFVLTTASAEADNPPKTIQRPVRVTTGIGEVDGWEHGLIEKNPNLSRWHWDPIYYYKQGYQNIGKTPLRGSGNPTGKQVGRGSQPTRLYQANPYHDGKPTHIPYSPQAMEELRGRLLPAENNPENTGEHKETILGKLMSPSSTEPPIATYKNNSLNTALKYNSQSTAVYGQLLKGKGSRGIYDAQKNK